MLVVGLTGDVGAGKSTVAQFWKGQGASLIDSDEIVRCLWKTDPLRLAVLQRYGEKSMNPDNGGVDTSFLASAVFSNPVDYDWVCSLLHPMVLEKIETRLGNLEGWIVVELPLLFESGRPPWLDIVVYVTAPREDRMARTFSRGWLEGELDRREKWLLPSTEKSLLADIVIENKGSRTELEKRIQRMGTKMKNISILLGKCRNPGGQERKRMILEAIGT